MSNFAQNPICPRCGYELTGVVATWQASCPLHGRCSECGIDLDWTDVFIVNEHPWLFEYHWRRNPIRRMVKTIVNALRPRRFWRSVKLTDPIHLRPAMIVALVCFTIGMIGVAVSEVHARNWINSIWFSGGPPSEGLEYWLRLIGEVTIDLPRILFERVPGLYVALFTMPLLFILAPVTLRRAKVRRAHVLRIGLYSLAWPVCIGVTWLMAEMVSEMLDWHSVSRVLDPWEWIAYTTRYDWRVYLWDTYLPGIVVLTIASGWMAIWWWYACRTYLQIRNSTVLVGFLVTVLWLLAVTVEVLAQSVQEGLLGVPFSTLN